jgi:hypothetical protein
LAAGDFARSLRFRNCARLSRGSVPAAMNGRFVQF